MCPWEVADSCWSTCSFLGNSLIQKHNMWKCSEKILLLHQHSFRFKNFVNSSEWNWLRSPNCPSKFWKTNSDIAPAQNKLSGATICLTPHKVCVNNYRNFQQESTGVVHYWLSGLQLLFYERLRCCSKCFFAYKWFLPPIWCRGLILLCFQNFKTHNQA